MDRRSILGYIISAPASLICTSVKAQLLHADASPDRGRRTGAILSASDFGVKADAGEDGSGTDNRAAFQAFFDVLATGRYEEAHIPPGKYALSEEVHLRSGRLGRLTLHGDGAEMIFTPPEPKAYRGFLNIWAQTQMGDFLRVEGLTLRLNRPSVRVGGSDMLRLSGFRVFEVEGVTIPSADNMGLTIGRSRAKGEIVVPDAILVRDCDIGGRREALPHSHGSIGDSGIWIVAPAIQTRITGCRVRETGDDGLYVGHYVGRFPDTTIARVEIDNNDVRDAGARGIGISVPHAHVHDNVVMRTNCPGMTCERMDAGDGSHALIENNYFKAAGRLEAGIIGARMMRKVHPHAIFINQPGGDITMRGNVIEAPLCDGINVLTHRDGDIRDLRIEGGSFRQIAPSDQARPYFGQTVAAFRRTGGLSRCLDVTMGATEIIDSNCLIAAWNNGTDLPDGPLTLGPVTLGGDRRPPDDRLVAVSGPVLGVDLACEETLCARLQKDLADTPVRLSGVP